MGSSSGGFRPTGRRPAHVSSRPARPTSRGRRHPTHPTARSAALSGAQKSRGLPPPPRARATLATAPCHLHGLQPAPPPPSPAASADCIPLHRRPCRLRGLHPAPPPPAPAASADCSPPPPPLAPAASVVARRPSCRRSLSPLPVPRKTTPVSPACGDYGICASLSHPTSGGDVAGPPCGSPLGLGQTLRASFLGRPSQFSCSCPPPSGAPLGQSQTPGTLSGMPNSVSVQTPGVHLAITAGAAAARVPIRWSFSQSRKINWRKTTAFVRLSSCIGLSRWC